MTESQEFCLRWNNHQATIISVFDYLLENETLVDCTLAAEGQYLKAHKVVLCACSPYLETLLSQHNDKHPILIFKDIKYHELKCMIEYMYKGEVNIAQDQLNHFLKAAESLQIKGLSESEEDAAPQTAVAKPRPPPPRAPPVQRTQPRPYPNAIRNSEADESPKRILGRTEAQSPTPRKRRRPAAIPGRASISGDDASNASEGHFDQSNCDVPTPTPSDITKAVAKVETNSELMLEPKTEYDDNSVEDITLDDDDEDYSQAGTSQMDNSQGNFGNWQDQTGDEVFTGQDSGAQNSQEIKHEWEEDFDYPDTEQNKNTEHTLSKLNIDTEQNKNTKHTLSKLNIDMEQNKNKESDLNTEQNKYTQSDLSTEQTRIKLEIDTEQNKYTEYDLNTEETRIKLEIDTEENKYTESDVNTEETGINKGSVTDEENATLAHRVKSIDNLRKGSERKKCLWSESDLKAAMLAVNEKKMTIHGAAKFFNIPRSTLRERWRSGTVTKSLDRKSCLAIKHEGDLCDRLCRLQETGFPITSWIVQRSVFSYCRENGIQCPFKTIKQKAGRSWLESFKKRNPRLFIAKNTKIKAGQSRHAVSKFFIKLQTILTEDLVDNPQLIYIIDNRGCGLGLHKHPATRFRQTEQEVTIISCANALGDVIPPMIVFKGNSFDPNWETHLSADIQIVMSEKGCMTPEVFRRWVTHFSKFKPEGKVLLIFDAVGALSYIDAGIVSIADKQNIRLLCYPCATFLSQPMDFVFKHFDTCWDEELRSSVRKYKGAITQVDFGSFFSKIWPLAATGANVIAGFGQTGIYPFTKSELLDEALEDTPQDISEEDKTSLSQDDLDLFMVCSDPESAASSKSLDEL